MQIYLLFFAMLLFLPLYQSSCAHIFSCKCFYISWFRASVRGGTFSGNSTRLLRLCHPSGFCKWDAFWILPFAALRSPARLILAVLLRRSYIYPFFLHPFS